MLQYFLQALLLVLILIKLAESETPTSNDIYKHVTPFNHLTNENTFSKYLKKYDPITISNNIHKELREKGLNITNAEMLDMVYEKIEAAGDLLKLKVQNGKTVVLQEPGRRQWSAPVGLFPIVDPFSLRPRLFELMKQAIYQARNKMVIMQVMREKYRTKNVYKMGYLTAKTDTACKTFSKVAKLAAESCKLAAKEPNKVKRYHLYEVQMSVERLLHLWFQVDLLVDLIVRNDLNLYKVLDVYHDKRDERWPFVD